MSLRVKIRNVSKLILPKLEKLNNKIAYPVIIILAIFALAINYFGIGIEDEYLLYKWNNNNVTTKHLIVIDSSTITTNICGQIVAGYSWSETEIWAGINSDTDPTCKDGEDSLRSSLYYALGGTLKWEKSYNKLILTDELRGNVFVLKRKW